MAEQLKEVHSQNVRVEVQQNPTLDEIRFKSRTPEVLYRDHGKHEFASDKTYVIKIYEVVAEEKKAKK